MSSTLVAATQGAAEMAATTQPAAAKKPFPPPPVAPKTLPPTSGSHANEAATQKAPEVSTTPSLTDEDVRKIVAEANKFKPAEEMDADDKEIKEVYNYTDAANGLFILHSVYGRFFWAGATGDRSQAPAQQLIKQLVLLRDDPLRLVNAKTRFDLAGDIDKFALRAAQMIAERGGGTFLSCMRLIPVASVRLLELSDDGLSATHSGKDAFKNATQLRAPLLKAAKPTDTDGGYPFVETREALMLVRKMLYAVVTTEALPTTDREAVELWGEALDRLDGLIDRAVSAKRPDAAAKFLAHQLDRASTCVKPATLWHEGTDSATKEFMTGVLASQHFGAQSLGSALAVATVSDGHSKAVCKHFNSGGCNKTADACAFGHVCELCFSSAHAIKNCPVRDRLKAIERRDAGGGHGRARSPGRERDGRGSAPPHERRRSRSRSRSPHRGGPPHGGRGFRQDDHHSGGRRGNDARGDYRANQQRFPESRDGGRHGYESRDGGRYGYVGGDGGRDNGGHHGRGGRGGGIGGRRPF